MLTNPSLFGCTMFRGVEQMIFLTYNDSFLLFTYISMQSLFFYLYLLYLVFTNIIYLIFYKLFIRFA